MTRRQNVRDRWYWLVIRTDLVTGSCRELLSLLAVHHMTELGHVKVPRKILADQLGIAEHRVTVRMGDAVKAGLLTRVGGGINAQTVQYAATFPPGQGAAKRHPQPEVQVSGKRHPQNDTQESPPGCRNPTPIRARTTYTNREPEPAPESSRVERDHLHPVGSIDGATSLIGRRINAAVPDHALQANR